MENECIHIYGTYPQRDDLTELTWVTGTYWDGWPIWKWLPIWKYICKAQQFSLLWLICC